MTDIELLERIKAEPAEFSAVFKLYYKPIFGYIFRRTGEVDDSADIAAETFYKAFNYIGTFNYRGISLKVWLYRIATNELKMHFRHRRKSVLERLDAETVETYRNSLEADRSEIETEFHRHETFREVLAALKTLPPKYQEVLSLKYFEEKDNPEICEILGIKTGTLKSLLSRGLAKLRDRCNQK